MTLTLEEEVEVTLGFDYKQLAEEVAQAAIDAEGFPYEAEVSLLLVSAKDIRQINKQQRQVDAPTDVLSFPLISYAFPGDFSKIEEDGDNFNPDTGEALLGDIVLCVDKVKEQAKSYGHSEKREYAFLILHSFLHLFGYDHMTEADSKIMEAKQNHILCQMGILR